MSLPWEPGFIPPVGDPDLIKKVTDLAKNATVVTEDAINSALRGAEQVIPAISANAPTGGDWVGAIEQVAVQAAIPMIQKRVATAAAQALQDELNKFGPAPIPVIPSNKDLKKVDAWERAGRTFLAGIAVTILGVIVQVIGQATTTGVDFFHKEGWVAVGTLFVGALITSLSSYLLRMFNEPAGAAVDSSAKT